MFCCGACVNLSTAQFYGGRGCPSSNYWDNLIKIISVIRSTSKEACSIDKQYRYPIECENWAEVVFLFPTTVPTERDNLINGELDRRGRTWILPPPTVSNYIKYNLQLLFNLLIDVLRDEEEGKCLVNQRRERVNR